MNKDEIHNKAEQALEKYDIYDSVGCICYVDGYEDGYTQALADLHTDDKSINDRAEAYTAKLASSFLGFPYILIGGRNGYVMGAKEQRMLDIGYVHSGVWKTHGFAQDNCDTDCKCDFFVNPEKVINQANPTNNHLLTVKDVLSSIITGKAHIKITDYKDIRVDFWLNDWKQASADTHLYDEYECSIYTLGNAEIELVI